MSLSVPHLQKFLLPAGLFHFHVPDITLRSYYSSAVYLFISCGAYTKRNALHKPKNQAEDTEKKNTRRSLSARRL